jgi:hypothetical protein
VGREDMTVFCYVIEEKKAGEMINQGQEEETES